MSKNRSNNSILIFSLKISLILLLVTLFPWRCSQEEEQVNPLVGEWELDSLSQKILVTVRQDTMNLESGFQPGDTLINLDVSWATFRNLGVSGVVELKKDNRYHMEGYFPFLKDTIIMSEATTNPDNYLRVLPAEDFGNWSVSEDLSSLTLSGIITTLTGELNVDNVETPTSLIWQNSTYDSTRVFHLGIENNSTIVYIDLITNTSIDAILGFKKKENP